jgi:hypothetical protein
MGQEMSETQRVWGDPFNSAFEVAFVRLSCWANYSQRC